MAIIASLMFVMCCNKGDIPIESNWQVEHIFKNNNEIAIPAEHDVTLAFLKEGKIAGNTGCNRFSGEFEIKDKSGIELSNIGSTRMMCPDIQFEISFIEMLEKASQYSINEGRLTLKEDSGDIIAILKEIAPTAMEN